MKKIFHKNQIAITSLAVLIAVAGYLNFTQNEIPAISQNTDSGKNKENISSGKNAEVQADGKNRSDKKEADQESMATVGSLDISDADSLISEKAEDPTAVEDEETIGDAVLTQAQVGEYIAGAKMKREQTHSKTKDALNQIIENDKLSENSRQEAVDKLARLADIIEKEASIEQLLNAKGYGDCVVSVGDENIDVILNFDDLDQSDRAQIEDIVTRKTGYPVSQIVISRMRLSEPDYSRK